MIDAPKVEHKKLNISLSMKFCFEISRGLPSKWTICMYVYIYVCIYIYICVCVCVCVSYVLLRVNNSASFVIMCRKLLPSTAVFV